MPEPGKRYINPGRLMLSSETWASLTNSLSNQNWEKIKRIAEENAPNIADIVNERTAEHLYVGQLITDAKGCLHEVADIVVADDKVTGIITTFGGEIPLEEITIVF